VPYAWYTTAHLDDEKTSLVEFRNSLAITKASLRKSLRVRVRVGAFLGERRRDEAGASNVATVRPPTTGIFRQQFFSAAAFFLAAAFFSGAGIFWCTIFLCANFVAGWNWEFYLGCVVHYFELSNSVQIFKYCVFGNGKHYTGAAFF
jgi:hypothetical protein